jgi:hypothetical protein
MKGPETDKKKVPKLNLDFKVQNEFSTTPKVFFHRLAFTFYREELAA